MAWGIVYCATKSGRVPAEEFLDGCPANIEARFAAVLEAVRDAPPPQFSGGGYWEAMHGDMGGYYEIRLTGPGRRQYRLFCLLDNGSQEELREYGFASLRSLQSPAWSRTRARSSQIAITPRSGSSGVNTLLSFHAVLPPECEFQTWRTRAQSSGLRQLGTGYRLFPGFPRMRSLLRQNFCRALEGSSRPPLRAGVRVATLAAALRTAFALGSVADDLRELDERPVSRGYS